MRFVYPILFIVLFILFYDYTNILSLPAIFVVSLSPGERSSGSIYQNDPSSMRTRIHMNGGD